ncbi:glycosyltransferase [Natronorubrum sulfidifaciens]|uniref:Group 1 glycosyl transferase n=1 Tax=Natronorubrum sulfidifaciens JCM 14089 TaxID=1230460 RepID=L9W5H1_9EURY|nr:glycosyltransferase [Natronorubrum sulfidifaciens]ELY44602.1 group 1 glycosyl transferase [Natronorubrum sulfidifaciens JCM 14089]
MHSPAPPARSIAAYETLTDRRLLERLATLAATLEDVRVLHVNSAASGGGVAELLRSIVPVCTDLGVDTDWLVIDAEESFFEVTKALHNGLQGDATTLTDEMKATYRAVTERNAATIDEAYDLVVLHDPQPLGMVEPLMETMPDTTIVWRCHLDLSAPASEPLAFVSNYMEHVDHAIFSRAAYETTVPVPSSSVIHPSIDPLAAKNEALDDATVAAESEQLAPISFDTPLVTQVSRFDPWKDQLGTLEAYRRLTDRIPDAQLALVGSMADDDPEGGERHEQVAATAATDPDVHVLTDLSDTAVNVLQRQSDVVVQKSLREGFGLVVSEALWKRTPVVGSTVGGIPLQIEDGRNGYLVEPDDVVGLSRRVEQLLRNDVRRLEFGQYGREVVRERFLLPRQLAEFLTVVADLVSRPS